MKIKQLISEDFDTDFDVDYSNPDNTVPKDLSDYDEDKLQNDDSRGRQEDPADAEIRKSIGDDAFELFKSLSPQELHLLRVGFENGLSVELTERNEQTFQRLVDLGLIDETGDLSRDGYKIGYATKKKVQH